MSQPRNFRFDDDVYLALMAYVAGRRAKGEKTNFTEIVNELLRLIMPIPPWEDLKARVAELEREVKMLKG